MALKWWRVYKRHIMNGKKWHGFALDQWFLQCGPQTNSISVRTPWKPVRSVYSRAPPLTYSLRVRPRNQFQEVLWVILVYTKI